MRNKIILKISSNNYLLLVIENFDAHAEFQRIKNKRTVHYICSWFDRVIAHLYSENFDIKNSEYSTSDGFNETLLNELYFLQFFKCMNRTINSKKKFINFC